MPDSVDAPFFRARALVFEDPSSALLLKQIERIAPSEANVLIIGDTGTGKELIARHVHALSARRGKAFVAVNCGAFSDALIESELFGHEKGAFTGAFGARAGWFEAAHGGTIFLDEIGDLPLHTQVKLLRVLQEREVARLGSRRPTPIDVRIIAATNVRLEEAVRLGRFREDLFYRLQVVQLSLLPLAKRPGDILPLARHFISQFARQSGEGSFTLSSASEAKLLAHAWRGNIRELENVIHYALLMARDKVITPEILNFSVSPQSPENHESHASRDPLHAGFLQLKNALAALYEEDAPELFDRIEALVIASAFEHCHKNQVRTASLLGISRNILRARLIRQGMITAKK
ncbi:MAG: sigma-54 dependent transcriptional regulator [Burkholderiales bacterium]|nr:sigma-54 dependent transcriptional regulator [Burkholderiales bacterium]